MSNKLKITYELNPLDEPARTKVEALLKTSMDWVHISENEWIVLINRFNEKTLDAEIQKHFKTKTSTVTVTNIKKTKIYDIVYIAAKNGEVSEVLFTARY